MKVSTGPVGHLPANWRHLTFHMQHKCPHCALSLAASSPGKRGLGTNIEMDPEVHRLGLSFNISSPSTRAEQYVFMDASSVLGLAVLSYHTTHS